MVGLDIDEFTIGSKIIAAGIPFTHDRDALIQRLNRIQSNVHLLFLHQGVSGVEINSKGFTLNEALTPDMIPSNIAMAFSGHYHSNKQVTSNLIIPGSLTQLNWGDRDETRGWLDVTFDPKNGDIKIEQIESKASKFVQIDDISNLVNIEGNFIRVISADHNPSFVQNLSEQLYKQGAESVEIKSTEQINDNTAKVTTTHFNSLNEIIYAYAHEKERLGVIDAYDRHVGETILRGNYQVPIV